MIFTDSVPVTGVRRTEDGYLVAEARVARTGIQDYLGTEIGRYTRTIGLSRSPCSLSGSISVPR